MTYLLLRTIIYDQVVRTRRIAVNEYVCWFDDK